MNQKNLKECPICNSDKASIAREYDEDGFGVFLFVECGGCRLRTAPQFTSEECPQTLAEVRDRWNIRGAERNKAA